MVQVGSQVAAWVPKTSGNTYIQYFGSDFGNIGSLSTRFDGSISSYLVSAGEKDGKVYFLRPLEK